MNELEKYRKQIDKINDKILESLYKRGKLVLEIGKIKKQKGMKIIDKKREKKQYARLRKKARKYKLNEKFVTELFKKMIKNSRKIEK